MTGLPKIAACLHAASVAILAIVVVVAALATPASAQALDRAKRALEQRDLAVARNALVELFDEASAERASEVPASLAAFRDAGATDTWLEAAEKWSRVHPEDPLVSYLRGAAWQDLKHLARAEEALQQARARAPDNPAVRELWAWNAVRRFDARAAVERAEGASFPGVEGLREEQRKKLGAEPAGMVAVVGILGAILLAATLAVLVRLSNTGG